MIPDIIFFILPKPLAGPDLSPDDSIIVSLAGHAFSCIPPSWMFGVSNLLVDWIACYMPVLHSIYPDLLDASLTSTSGLDT